MNPSVIPAEAWFIEPVTAWAIVITIVGLVSVGLGYLNSLGRSEGSSASPRSDEPTRHFDKAA